MDVRESLFKSLHLQLPLRERKYFDYGKVTRTRSEIGFGRERTERFCTGERKN